jgi:hypothetical protein
VVGRSGAPSTSRSSEIKTLQYRVLIHIEKVEEYMPFVQRSSLRDADRGPGEVLKDGFGDGPSTGGGDARRTS